MEGARQGRRVGKRVAVSLLLLLLGHCSALRYDLGVRKTCMNLGISRQCKCTSLASSIVYQTASLMVRPLL